MKMQLLAIEHSGFITKTYVDDFQNIDPLSSIFETLISNDKKKVLACLNAENTCVHTIDTDTKKLHTIILVPMRDQYLWYRSDQMFCDTQREPILVLLKTLASELPHFHEVPREALGRIEILERMQKLNNELINKTREIEKMNKKLNHLNAILNNRLVKDPLTGLVSRYQYRDEMLIAIKKMKSSFGYFCFIDIDNFKSVNDTYGHDTGDRYLQEFANRLASLPIENCIKMRIAGDEFALFISDVKAIDKSALQAIWEIIRSSVIYPIKIDQVSLNLSISLGIAVYGKDTDDIHLLIDYADFAMYQAKRQGKNQMGIFNKSEYTEVKLAKLKYKE